MQVDPRLRSFVEEELLAPAGLDAARFWAGFEELIDEIMPRNRALLAERDRLQAAIDEWHRAHPGAVDQGAYLAFLEQIGYLLPEPASVSVTTTDVAPEIASLAGPQLVVPVTNARYALNAVNARWGSLYDALYGTDVIPGPREPGYDPARGALVVEYARGLLDEFVPLDGASHGDATAYAVVDGALVVNSTVALADPSQLRGYRGEPDAPTSVLLRQNGLHLELRFDRASVVGAAHPAGLSDVVLESALTTIVDFEDSVACVDVDDKLHAYRNWLGLNNGTLSDTFAKGDRSVTRRLASDLEFTAPDGSSLTLPGRATMLVRNVGHLMTTDAVLDSDGTEIGEGVLDAVLTTLAALPAGADSIYIVKPKMHGPARCG